MTDDEIADWQKVELSTTVVLRDENGEVRSFGPGDQVPDWARAQITNPVAWGYEVRLRRGPKLEIAHGERYPDGLPGYVDVVCDRHSERWLVARFEAVQPLDDGQDGPTRWEWWWTSSLNGPAGPFAARSTVAWDGTGPEAGIIDGTVVNNDKPISIACNHAGCTLALNRRWSTVSRMFDDIRGSGKSEVSLLALVQTGRHT